MIKYCELPIEKLDIYESIEFKFTADKIYELEKISRGLGGIILKEKKVKQFTKDFGSNFSDFTKDIDKSNWKIFIAKDGEKVVGGCIIVVKTKGINMLQKRDDLAILWDIRIIEEYKYQGIGKKLFNIAKEWCKNNGFIELRIECQNNNYNAVNFYHKQGATLFSIKEFAYPNYPDEVQLIWHLKL